MGPFLQSIQQHSIIWTHYLNYIHLLNQCISTRSSLKKKWLQLRFKSVQQVVPLHILLKKILYSFFSEGRGRFSYLCSRAQQCFCELLRASLASLSFFINTLCFANWPALSSKVFLSKSSRIITYQSSLCSLLNHFDCQQKLFRK